MAAKKKPDPIPKYWLVKSEPESYSIEDLERDGRTPWTGIRNYQARNFMRDEMKVGELVFFYHSGGKTPGIAGIASVASKPYPDPTAFDRTSPDFDRRSKKSKPTWPLVDIEFKERFPRLILLSELKNTPHLEGMYVTRPGQRLSVQPVTKLQFDIVCEMAQAAV